MMVTHSCAKLVIPERHKRTEREKERLLRVHPADAALRSVHVDSSQPEGRTCARSAYADPEWIASDHNCVIDLKG